MAVENLTLSGIRAQRELAEKAIAKILADFHHATNLHIEFVEVENFKSRHLEDSRYEITHQEVRLKTERV